MDDNTVARIQQTMVDTGALAELEAHITELTTRAISSLAAAPIVEQARHELTLLADYVSWRNV
jgi:geranylgeranyl pyrophosphate synthase